MHQFNIILNRDIEAKEQADLEQYVAYVSETVRRRIMIDKVSLPLPAVRCLPKEEAACYLGIGVTLLSELEILSIKLGRRCLYDRMPE